MEIGLDGRTQREERIGMADKYKNNHRELFGIDRCDKRIQPFKRSELVGRTDGVNPRQQADVIQTDEKPQAVTIE